MDREGNLANWIVPGKMVPGMGGAMDLVVGAKKGYCRYATYPVRKNIDLRKVYTTFTAVKVVDMIITEMGVIEVRPGRNSPNGT